MCMHDQYIKDRKTQRLMVGLMYRIRRQWSTVLSSWLLPAFLLLPFPAYKYPHSMTAFAECFIAFRGI
ncbi:MAG: hypothetical protein JW882_02950 [Deltaproteobacteria bacterium]|nr:hypothetical protein [Deltaproteobacteria bacterium]